MQKFTALPAIILLIGANSLLAHPGHHHETGLPDFAAHILLGLQCLAACLIPATFIAFLLRSSRRKKSRPASLTNQEK